MSNVLNDFFGSVFFSQLRTNLIPIPTVPLTNVHTPSRGLIISECQVADKIMKLRPKSAPGPDGISARLLCTFCSSD